jgi:sarcosine oxidase subunit gamma
MPDALSASRRRAALAPDEAGGLVRPLGAAARFSLRLRLGDGDAAPEIAGLPLDIPINRWAGREERCAARLGPDEWLLIGAPLDAETMSSEIGRALAGRVHALVGISHRDVAVEVAGPHAARILNAGCPLDLDPRVAPPGFATRTLLGKAEIVLFRLTDARGFRVECGRSFARYVLGFLLEAARDGSAEI